MTAPLVGLGQPVVLPDRVDFVSGYALSATQSGGNNCLQIWRGDRADAIPNRPKGNLKLPSTPNDGIGCHYWEGFYQRKNGGG